GRAPRRATRDQFPHGLPAYGPSTVITPALVAGWCALHARRGSLPLGELLESAVTYARDGFAATQTFVRYAGEQADALAANPEAAEVFLPGGSPPVVGSVIRQAGLARTLEAIGAGAGMRSTPVIRPGRLLRGCANTAGCSTKRICGSAAPSGRSRSAFRTEVSRFSRRPPIRRASRFCRS